MAEEKIQITPEVDVTPSIAELKKLQRELKTTTDPVRFKELQQQIDDTKDAISAAKTGAGNFAEVLGTLPGPIGDIAGRAGNLVGTLKTFGQIKLSDVKGSFVELGKDIVDAAKGLGNLTGITKIYTVINNGLAKSFTAIGIAEGTAATGARAFAAALTATGVGAIVVAIGLAVSALMDLTTELYKNVTGQKELERATKATNDAIEKQNTLFDLDAKAAENRRKVAIAQMKAQGKSEKEIRDFQIKSAYDDYNAAYAAEQEAAKIANQAQGKADEETFKKAQDNFDKAQQRRKDAYATYLETGYNARAADLADQKAAAQKSAQLSEQEAAKRKAIRDKELAELTAGQKEAFLSTLSEKEKEEYLVNEKYQNLIHLATKYGEDTTVIKQAQQKELDAITTKYTQQEYEAQIKALELRNAKGELTEEEYQKNLYDLAVKYNNQVQDATIKYEAFKTQKRKKSVEDARELAFMEVQNEIDELDRRNEALTNDFAEDQARLEQKRVKLQEQRDIELSNTELTQKERLDILKKYADSERQIDKDVTESKRAEFEARTELQLAYANAVGSFGRLLQQAAGENKGLAIAGIVIEQAAAIASIAVNASKNFVKDGGVTSPLAWANLAAAGVQAASAVIAAKKGIDAISKTSIPGGQGGGSSAAVGTPPSFNAPRAMASPTIQATPGASPQTQIAQTIGMAQQRPIQAYVVSQQVSSQQALDRRTNGAATFGGG